MDDLAPATVPDLPEHVHMTAHDLSELADMIRDTHRMVSELHAAYTEVRPILDQMMTDLREQGVAGIMSAVMGGMFRPGR